MLKDTKFDLYKFHFKGGDPEKRGGGFLRSVDKLTDAFLSSMFSL